MKTMVNKAKAFLKVRHQAVRQAMSQLNLDGILIAHTPDLAYLTDFSGSDSVGIITQNDFHLITDFRYQEQAGMECGWVKLGLREGSMENALAMQLGQLKLKRVGFESNTTTVGQLDRLMDGMKAKKITPPELVPLDDVLPNIRKIKDDNELDLIRKSVAIAEEAYTAVRGMIKPGLTENHIAGLMISELRSRGADMASFPVIVASGHNSSLPHHQPGEGLIQKDAPLVIDWGAMFHGYASDITRTLLLGRVDTKIREIYKVVYEAQKEALRFIRPGVTTLEADAIARDVISKAGYGREFGHGLGHGIGREIHELPTLRMHGAGEEFRPGMVVTVEPGIYLKGVGGVRIEDDVLITHSGCEVLTSLDKTLEACHVE